MSPGCPEPPADRPCLLVSVRDSREAEAALAGGAEVIDFKEPSAGSLGRLPVAQLARLVQELRMAEGSPEVLLSAALGELLDWQAAQADALADALADHPAHSLGLVKFGLAGCARQSDWQLRWLQAGRRFSPFTALVAVAYADARAASAPAFDEVLRLAATGPAATLLIDTWDKSQGGLLAHWSLAQLQDVIHQARQFGLRTAVAGSLDIAAIEQIVPLKPDFIAVRTAACDGAREGVVSARRVARLSRCIADSARIRPAY